TLVPRGRPLTDWYWNRLMSSSFFSQCFGYSASIMFVYTNMGIYTCFGAQGVGVEFSIRDFDFPAEPFNCFLQTCDGLRICLVVFEDIGHFVCGNQFCKIGDPPPPALRAASVETKSVAWTSKS